MIRTRLFDAAVEDPDLLKADRQAREARRERRRPAAGVMIEPRIAARRATVIAEAAAAASKRRRRLAKATIVVVLLGLTAALVLLSPLASVGTIEVRGAGRSGEEAVRTASGLGARPPLVRVDGSVVGRRIEALPWIRDARLEKRWPRTLVVTVEERQPVAVSPCDLPSSPPSSSACLVDADGRVLAATSDEPKVAVGLPRLVGVPASGRPGETLSEAARGALAVAVALPTALRPLVLGVREQGSEVSLDLQAPGRQANPPVVRLGPPERIPAKLTAAATVLARTSVNGVAVLDVRVPESPALTRVPR